ncbi:MAG: hypothetical protein J2P49_04060 [Methylocapsa sp.]|nr:hypothetical protein [Methylocapsa sp.]
MQKFAWYSLRLVSAQTASSNDLHKSAPAGGWWFAAIAIAVASLVALAHGLPPPRYNAQVRIQTGPRPGALIGWRAGMAALRVAQGAGGQARLLASRDLARQVISELDLESYPEFDFKLSAHSVTARALIFLGVKRDPARDSARDRVLGAFQQRLRIAGPDKRGIITISFQSENAELAARAANRLAELFVNMRAGAKDALPQTLGAHILAFAAVPTSPVQTSVILLVAVTAIAAACSAFAAARLPRLTLRGHFDAPAARQSIHTGRISRVKLSERLNEAAPTQSPPPTAVSFFSAEEGGRRAKAQFLSEAAAAIKSCRAQQPGRSIRIIASQPYSENLDKGLRLALARHLAQEERTIAICLDAAARLDRELQTGTPAPGGSLARDLIAGKASFADVIRRDPVSRLHLLPLGKISARDFPVLRQIADALAGTYSFIMLILPDAGFDPKAKSGAERGDFQLVDGGADIPLGWRAIAAFAGGALLACPAADVTRCSSKTAA